MIITNTQNTAYWFGPMYLPAGNGQTLTIDDTSDTGLYLLDDDVADAVNILALSGEITVVPGTASPYPRPTGVPALLHGVGSPQGKVYAPQGSLYMRRDNLGSPTALLTKTSGVSVNTGWSAIMSPWEGLDEQMGLQASAFPMLHANAEGAPTSGTAQATGVWLSAGVLLTGLVVNVVSGASGLSDAYLGLYSATGSTISLAAVTENETGSFGTAEWVKLPFSVGATATPYLVPTSGLYYLAFNFAGTTPPSLTYINGAGSTASQEGLTSLRPYWEQASVTTLPSTPTPAATAAVYWIGAY